MKAQAPTEPATSIRGGVTKTGDPARAGSHTETRLRLDSTPDLAQMYVVWSI
jgi:hypothetical protein